jgi:chromosome segregation ATPase
MKVNIFLLIVSVISVGTVQGADEAKLRETLRTLTLRLRSAETDRNNLLTEKAQLTQDNKALTEKVDALTKQAAADKETIATLTSKSTNQEAALTEAKETLEKWKKAYEQVAAVAQKEKASHDMLADEVVLLQRKVSDRESKNRELFKLANEILTRYEKFSLGEALAAREPFTGLTRVKLENLVQDYQDKLSQQQLTKQ